MHRTVQAVAMAKLETHSYESCQRMAPWRELADSSIGCRIELERKGSEYVDVNELDQQTQLLTKSIDQVCTLAEYAQDAFE